MSANTLVVVIVNIHSCSYRYSYSYSYTATASYSYTSKGGCVKDKVVRIYRIDLATREHGWTHHVVGQG